MKEGRRLPRRPSFFHTTRNASGRFFLVVVFGLAFVLVLAVFILVVGLIVARGLGFFIRIFVLVVAVFVVTLVAFFLFLVGRLGGFDRRGGGMIEDIIESGFE
ncbi:exported hypothetical protein [Mesorhizobium sp. ORS 3324]|nr:exported hypothetical protein [Mesorhizobium sp. ORS 3324]